MTGNTGFLAALVLAAGAHVGALALLPSAGGGETQGGGGVQNLSISVAGADVAAALAEWDTSPEATTEATALASLIETAPAQINARPNVSVRTERVSALPDVSLATPPQRAEALSGLAMPPPPSNDAPTHAPTLDTGAQAAEVATLAAPEVGHPPAIASDAPAPPDRAVLASLRPAPRMETRAQGSGESATPGAGATSAPRATASQAAQASAEAAWASAIQQRIARAQVYPRGTRGDGRVRLALTIRANGQLADVRIITSSGVSAFDKAALRAAKRAAPFPKAPDVLSKDRFAFGQWVAFKR